jgi:hypothetical protein
MALRKFLFMNQSEGYSQEQAASDELSLGKITLSGVSGVALDVGNQLISNVAQPVADTDAARRIDVQNSLDMANSYTDQEVAAEAQARQAADETLQDNIDAEQAARVAADGVLQGNIDTEQAARIAADSDLQDAIDAEEARALAAEGVLQTNIDNEATARTNADNVLAQDITDEENARIAADQTLQQNIDTEEAARISADNTLRTDFEAADDLLEQDYIARDVVVLDSAKAYADSLQAGFIVKAPARLILRSDSASLSGLSDIDGVTPVAGDRILVARITPSEDNGIYVAAAGAWARASDLDVSADFKDGVSVFVGEGTQYADSTWVLITNNPIVMDTTPVEFIQFSGLGQITAGEGLSKTGNTLDVNVGNGVHIAADAVAVDLSTTPGLQFESGKLAAKPDAARGLDKDGSGLYVKHDGSKALAMDSSNGLQVVVDGSKALTIDATTGLQVKADAAKALKIDATNGLQNVLDTETMDFRALGGGVVGLGVNYDANRGLHVGGPNNRLSANIGGGALEFNPTDGYIQVVADEAQGVAIDATEGLQVKYDSSKALAMDAAAGLQVVADTSKAISVSASGVAVELATDPGLQFSSGKLDMKLASSARLVKDANGLDVVGLPLQFKIANTATNANVTATALNSLTQGDTVAQYHYHISQKTSFVGAQAIAGARCVYLSGLGQVSVGSCTSAATSRIIGLSLTSTGVGSAANVVSHGLAPLTSSGWGGSLVVGTPYYLGSDGTLVEFSALQSGDRVIRMGFAHATGGLHVAIQDMGSKA